MNVIKRFRCDTKMQTLYRVILFSSFLILIHGRRKEVKQNSIHIYEDPFLENIFSNDIAVKRRRRSFDSQDESRAQKFPTDIVSTFQKRQAEGFSSQLMQMNQLNQPNIMQEQFDKRSSVNSEPIISSPLNIIPGDGYRNIHSDDNQVISNAVDPALFAANYLPLPGEPEDAKKAMIPHPNDENFASMKSSDVTSFPVSLRVHPQTSKTRQVVPHTKEYGETVESIENARKLTNFKRDFVPVSYNQYASNINQYTSPDSSWHTSPDTLYSSEIYKRNDIPQPPSTFTKFHSKRSNPKSSRKHHKNNGVSDAVTMQQNGFYSSQNDLQSLMSAQQNSARIQNTNGQQCADQYDTCAGFAKNNYCAKFPDLMKIQCKKSCKFCSPSEIAASAEDNTNIKADYASVSSNKTTDLTKINDTQTKNTRELKQSTDTVDESASGSVDEFSGSGDESGDGEDAENKEGPNNSSSTKVFRLKAGSPTTTVQKLEKVAADEGSKKEFKSDNSTKRTIAAKSSSSGSASGSESGFDSQSGVSGSGSVSSEPSSRNIKQSQTKRNEKKSNIPGEVSRKVDNKVWKGDDKKGSRISEFSIPFKRYDIPMPSLNIGSMVAKQTKSELSDSKEESGSGSGEYSDEESNNENNKVDKAATKINNENLPSTSKSKKDDIKSKKSEKKKNQDLKKSLKKSKVTIKEKSTEKEKNKHEKSVKSKKRNQTKKSSLSKKDSTNLSKANKKTSSKKKTKMDREKKTNIPAPPTFHLPVSYPKIDLRAIASALAHYEQAALELAGEYPRTSSNIDITEVQRSRIPHPIDAAVTADSTIQTSVQPLKVFESAKELSPYEQYRQNVEIAKVLNNEKTRKSTIPKYLKLTPDAKKEVKTNDEADTLENVRKRFEIPGLEPTLNDYYAETGKLDPFENKKENIKKSRIENKRKQLDLLRDDPYEYLRNMPEGASMEPIVDPKTRSTVPSDHSYPVVLMKVSPADEKYRPEEATKRGRIHEVDAEGLPVNNAPVKKLTDPPPPLAEAYISPPKSVSLVHNPPQQQTNNYEMQNNPSLEAAYQMQQQPENNMEQMNVPKMNAAFAQGEPVPGPNGMRTKMLSAFFSVKNNELSQEQGSGGGSGDIPLGDSDVGARRTLWPGGFKK